MYGDEPYDVVSVYGDEPYEELCVYGDPVEYVPDPLACESPNNDAEAVPVYESDPLVSVPVKRVVVNVALGVSPVIPVLLNDDAEWKLERELESPAEKKRESSSSVEPGVL